jgi:hypothetical protein
MRDGIGSGTVQNANQCLPTDRVMARASATVRLDLWFLMV